ncbi:hypothetical protein DL766_004007 [Monosporascus sp. MC13-8B]|uniref:Uncharacterized protein n=1 Tax=Monosporascus cannonballus TaxID=155416 RepID=A0ABY0GT37_9PEZI|nr:hypothetical protein DL762_009528 [Monosporascus cannonballus]RYO95927.1 hypothetical protein DL763_003475 [Monosporascus cannonballus]RYP32332.1 hypothetical protein DL766_004007 [Monosporascus sp. MC13-8B]
MGQRDADALYVTVHDRKKTDYYNPEQYADLRPESYNWKCGEKDGWQPASTKHLVILCELRIPDGVSSEEVYHVIEKRGNEMVLNGSYYGQQYGGGIPDVACQGGASWNLRV